MRRHDFRWTLIRSLFFMLAIAIPTVISILMLNNNKNSCTDITSSVPSMNRFVNDTANIMSSEEIDYLESFLSEERKKIDNQIAVLTIPSLKGSELEDFSLKVSEAWQLGQKDKDNGVLLLIVPNDHKLRIEVGYGLEPILTDAICGRIIRNVITPSFKTNDYGKGITLGVQAIVSVINGDTKDIDSIDSEKADEGKGIPIWLIILFVILIIIGLLITIIDGDGSSSSSGGYSSYSSSSDGGGHFGGGGASGSW